MLTGTIKYIITKITYKWMPYANTLTPIIDALKEWG